MILLLIISVLCSVSCDIAQIQKPSRAIRIVGDEFMLDDEPLQIVSGSMHYFRVPAEYWQDRLRKIRAAGLNSVSTYVEWSFHEPEERSYNFEGDRDIVKFIQLAASEGLHVLLRPGPYICAERDLGGLPYWLLGKYPKINLRSTDKDFIEETTIWMDKLFTLLTPLLYSNGGPIILVQVENEYGSYGNDIKYKTEMYNIFKKHVGDAALLYTTDGTHLSYVRGGAINNTLTTIDFGPSRRLNVDAIFGPLRQVMPKGPLMNSEFYPGWLTHWGETFQTGSTPDLISSLRSLLQKKININFYVFHGGSNFEFTAGANYFKIYQPDITSYDYDAPISEAGDLTPKYYAIRDVLSEFGMQAPLSLELPENSLKAAYGAWSVQRQYGLLTAKGRQTLGKPYKHVYGANLPTFEALRQRSGFILYETVLSENSQGLLQINDARDRVYIYVDNVFLGIISRMHKMFSLPITSKSNATLSLLVENQGRINFGNHKDIHDYKGIRSVLYDKKPLEGMWTITGFPLEVLPQTDVDKSDQTEATWGPVLYEGTFTIPHGMNPLDTYLNPTGWGKGYIWVNGHNLGRYWPGMGPQVTLYLPGVWLLSSPDTNRIQILELEAASPSQEVQSIGYPILNSTTRSSLSSSMRLFT